ncbi:L-arabinose 1-dehydrogenase [Methylobrevis pamukkalensis]|uniref:L-arabinose 1-dehydrogenase n=1 Tax=Methylobrevis pamukkalensis TaxID=1439726 RepID=A0A1E3H5S4_9HYPH|nr:L-arabinose 1-dehydrogenase [Methylobrevis pamukkalensis]
MTDSAAAPIRLAIVGLGKIARDQHLPAIATTPGIDLVAVASRNASLEGVANFRDIDEMIASGLAFDAVALCTPPQGRYRQAMAALSAGKHVLLEKPPGASLSEIGPMVDLAAAQGVTLFATWHSRFAPAVEPAREFLATTTVRSLRVDWKEDVRHWHPGQAWIWEPGGFGVFDPGINALSIVTRILPRPFFLDRAELFFPANRAAPIAANLDFTDAAGLDIRAEFDWRQTGPQTWDIQVATDAGNVVLSGGGKRMTVNGEVMVDAPDAEYRGIYARLAALVAESASDVDLAPLTHVADASCSAGTVSSSRSRTADGIGPRGAQKEGDIPAAPSARRRHRGETRRRLEGRRPTGTPDGAAAPHRDARGPAGGRSCRSNDAGATTRRRAIKGRESR